MSGVGRDPGASALLTDFFLAAGLEPVLGFLEGLRFTGDVDAMPEGTAFYPDEPILRVAAPLPQEQLVETRLAARSAYLAGFGGTATVLAGRRYGIPLYGTMAREVDRRADAR